MKKKYTAAIIGCGDIAHHHVSGYKLAGIEIGAVVDPLKSARDQFSAEYGITAVYESVENLFTEEKPDIVSVCTWHLLHPGPTICAAEAGVAGVICEKPMAVGLDLADQMIEACERSGTKLVISHQRRFTPGWEKARGLVLSGAIGNIIQIDSKVVQGLLNCGTHAIDGVRFILDDPQTEWVMGAVERRSERFERDTPIEDGCMGLIQMENGIQLNFQSDLDSKNASPGHFLFRGERGLIETTETWTRLWNEETNGWEEQSLGIEKEKIDVIGGMSNARQTKELVNWLEGGEEHRCSGRRARATVEIMMAILESARQNQVIRLPLSETDYPLQLMIEEGLLPPEEEGAYDIRGYLNRQGVDEVRYSQLRAEGMGHHPIMRKLYEERKSNKEEIDNG